ncbi:GAF domain-containing protein [Geodermatophilus sp. YIM 151500]|uniref:GAF domain-containing protein n=1 Tax=Geodermatophilus sp. YIM 151500 TaxID=2984531 RepID=UPI0021E46458|nr:GAF domain-containing protein [Geodermatophilus sp. YIM 151500]MCV2490908.1 GAF domain-containing protein [Geodermatophilus sp. YIM 151500]
MTEVAEGSTDTFLPTLADPDRLAALDHTGLLAGDGDPALDRVARLASTLVDAPRAFVTLVTPERQHLAGMVRRDDPENTSRETPLSASLCQFAVATEEPLVIADSHRDPLVRDMEPVRNGAVGAYAGVPLRTSDGDVLGTLCVVDRSPRTWDDDHLALLDDLTALAAHEVEQRLGSVQGRRLRELAQQVAREVPPLADALHSLAEIADAQEEPRLHRYASLSRSRMETVLSLARRLGQASSGASARQRPRVAVDLRAVAERCVRSARAVTGTDAIRLDVGPEPLLVTCDPSGLERSITHVVVTALHHSGGGAPVELALGRSRPVGAHAGGRHATVATLTVTARDSRVPTGELARIVSRFHEATCDETPSGQPEVPATIRIAGGAVVAESGSVHGRASTEGPLVLRTQWPLTSGGAVSAR